MDKIFNIDSQESFDQMFLADYTNASMEDKVEIEKEIISNKDLVNFAINSKVAELPDSLKESIVQFCRIQQDKMIDIEVDEGSVKFLMNNSVASVAELAQNENTLGSFPGVLNKDHVLSSFLMNDILSSFDLWIKDSKLNSAVSGVVKKDGSFYPSKATALPILNKGMIKVKQPGALSPSAVKSLISEDLDGDLTIRFSKDAGVLSFDMDYQTWSALALNGIGEQNAALMKRVMVAAGVSTMIMFSSPAMAEGENGSTTMESIIEVAPAERGTYNMLREAIRDANSSLMIFIKAKDKLPADFSKKVFELRQITKKLNDLGMDDSLEEYSYLAKKFDEKLNALEEAGDMLSDKQKNTTIKEDTSALKINVKLGEAVSQYKHATGLYSISHLVKILGKVSK